MKHNRKWLALALTGAMTLSLLVGCAGNQNTGGNQGASSDTLVIAEQGMFSAGGTVISSDGTFDVSNYYTSRKGSTSHVDHANAVSYTHLTLPTT